MTNTAAALPHEYIGKLREIFPNALMFAMYGLTECKRVSYLEPELIDQKPGSVGKAIPGTEIYLLSTDDKPVPAGEPGILHVRGPHVMLGYWNNPERTAKMLREGKLPGERILRTGDWFRMDQDGYLYFVARSDDIIKTRGEKVSPAEVESALYRLGGIQEAVVIGVPDEILGQAVRAYVVLSPDVERDERRIRRGLMRQLENFMLPRDIVFMDALPKSPNGKVSKQDLP
jgi:acyl-coenzyme A synthetase/AMP-(fatty) acid ligase